MGKFVNVQVRKPSKAPPMPVVSSQSKVASVGLVSVAVTKVEDPSNGKAARIKQKIVDKNPEAFNTVKNLFDSLFRLFDGQTHYRTTIFPHSDSEQGKNQKSKENDILKTLVDLGGVEHLIVPYAKNPKSTIPPSAYRVRNVQILEKYLGDEDFLFQLLWPNGVYREYVFQSTDVVTTPQPPPVAPPVPAVTPVVSEPPAPQQEVAAQAEPPSVDHKSALPLDSAAADKPLSAGDFNEMFVAHFGMSFVEFLGGMVRILHASGESQIYVRDTVDKLTTNVVNLEKKVDLLLNELANKHT